MAIRGFCISAPEAPARRNAAGVVSLPATERLQLRFDCGALDPGPQKPLPNDPRDCAGLCAPSHHRRKPITAARLLSAQCRKRNSGLKLRPQVSQLRACDEVAQQLWTQRWDKRWSAGAAEQYLDGRSHNHAAGSEKSPVAWMIDPKAAKKFLSRRRKHGVPRNYVPMFSYSAVSRAAAQGSDLWRKELVFKHER